MATKFGDVSGLWRRRTVLLRAALMSGLATVLVPGLVLPTDAHAWSLFGDHGAPPPVKREKRAATRWQPAAEQKPQKAAAQPEKKLEGPYQIIVSIKTQRIWLYADGELAGQSIVSTGTPGHDTPVGVFSVLQKNRHHRSNIYSNAPMPYMQRLTWSGVALHQGFVTGRPASHGCIRLQQPFADRLWNLTDLGARVIVSPDDVAPRAIAHAKLFVAKPKPAPVAALQPDPVPTAKIRLATNAERTDAPTVPVADVADANDPLAEGRSLTDMIRSEVSRDTAQPATTEPATGSVTEPKPVVAGPAKELPVATPKDTVAEPAKSVAEPAKSVAEPAKAPEPVKAAEQPASEAAPAKQVTAPAETPRALDKGLARATGKELPLKPGPITVFVSRATGKVYVRKGFSPVFEAPVTIAEPKEPFGTHVFTALDQKADGSMRWNVVSMSNVASRDRRSPLSQQIVGPAKAEDVLSRITIPDEALDRISELMTAGASFIVSDLATSHETTPRGTDFIVQVR